MKISSSFSAIFLAIIAALCVVLLLIMFYPITVAIPNRQPYLVFTKQVKRGGDVVYQVDACKTLALTALVSRNFIDAKSLIIYPAISAPNNVPAGCHKTNITIAVPMYLPKGHYFIHLTVEYQINGLRTVTQEFDTEKFEVIQ